MANYKKPHNYICQVGKQFGKWLVLNDSERKFGRVYWLCRCACGVERIVSSQTVKSGASTSCGCSKGATYTLGNHTSKGIRNPAYASWMAMRGRCNNPNVTHYKYYGGKGITVCERWNKSFEAFLEDMGEPPKGKETLDRIDNAIGYSPDNCRWASRKEQTQNRSWSHPAIPRNRDVFGRYK